MSSLLNHGLCFAVEERKKVFAVEERTKDREGWMIKKAPEYVDTMAIPPAELFNMGGFWSV